MCSNRSPRVISGLQAAAHPRRRASDYQNVDSILPAGCSARYRTAQNLVISAAAAAAEGVVTKPKAEEEISRDKAAVYGACARSCGTVGVEPN